MKNLVAKESIEAVAVKEENIMETQIAVGKEAFSKEVVLRNIAQTDIRLQKLLGYRNYDFYDPKLFMLGLKDGETISEALLRRGAYNIGQVKTRSTRYKNCYTDYFMYPDNESTVVAVVYNNEKEEFYIFGYRPVLVLSGSMEPYMETNSIAIVQKTKDINEGDVVMFRIDEDTRVCHRAVAIDAEGNITTKGDNNEKADYDKVSEDMVEGKVVARLNFLSGLISKFR